MLPHTAAAIPNLDHVIVKAVYAKKMFLSFTFAIWARKQWPYLLEDVISAAWNQSCKVQFISILTKKNTGNYWQCRTLKMELVRFTNLLRKKELIIKYYNTLRMLFFFSKNIIILHSSILIPHWSHDTDTHTQKHNYNESLFKEKFKLSHDLDCNAATHSHIHTHVHTHTQISWFMWSKFIVYTGCPDQEPVSRIKKKVRCTKENCRMDTVFQQIIAFCQKAVDM